MTTRAYNEGYDAYHFWNFEGWESENPYDEEYENPQFNEWLAGWAAANLADREYMNYLETEEF